jgi:DNA-binding transcriptional MocR family regulator
MEIAIDRKAEAPLYLQIVEQIADLIASGKLAAGFRLPPERQLARTLGVNRSTILNAYRELKARRLVEARVGRGTSILPTSAQQPARQPPRPAPGYRDPDIVWQQLFRDRAVRSQDGILRDLLALSEREDTIPLAMGLPAPDLLPLRTYQELMGEVIAELGPRSLLHSPTEGVTPLRAALVEWAAERDIQCHIGQIQILSGSQQGLDMVARVFLDPGDVVVVEEPTYIGALQTFRDARARLVGIPTDAQGMCTDVLASVLARQRPKFIYTLPTFQNPSGVVMSLERRHHLLELASRYQVPLLEDDPYSDLYYEDATLPSLKSLDQNDLVLYLSTVSKVLFPGLRLGWLIAPEAATRRFTLAKQGMDLHSSTPNQYLLERFLRQGYFAQYLRKIRPVYRQRRDVMHRALSQSAPAGLTWTKPAGGFYIWCLLPEGSDRSRLLARAAESGVSFLPGWACFAQDPGRSHMRLNFAFPDPEQIEIGVSRLVAAVTHAACAPRGTLPETKVTPPIV